MTTANDLISGALRAITSITPGEAVSGAEIDNGMVVLNSMLASWSAQSQMPPFRTLEPFALTSGKASYTIGTSGADFNSQRPDRVTWAWRRDSNGIDYTLEVIPKNRYNSVQVKNLSALPEMLYYDAQFPNGVIYLYPADVQADTLYLESLKPLNQFTNTQTVMILPGEYEEGIKYLLAERLAPEYGATIGQDLRKLITDAEKRIKNKNVHPVQVALDPALRGNSGQYNIYTGY